MTDPMDENTGVPSGWGQMVEEMEMKGKHGRNGEWIITWRIK